MSNNKKYQSYNKNNRNISEENIKNKQLAEDIITLLCKYYPKNTVKTIGNTTGLKSHTIINWLQRDTKITGQQILILLKNYGSIQRMLGFQPIHQKHRNTNKKEIMKERVKKVLFLLKINPKLSAILLENELCLSRGQIEYILIKLKKSGTIKHKGSTKAGYWIVNKTIKKFYLY